MTAANQPDAFAPSTVMDPEAMVVAGEYARGLLDLVASDEEAEALAGELQRLAGLLDEIDGCDWLLAEAPLSRKESVEMVRRVFSGRASELLEALLVVMAGNGRLGLVRAAGIRFRELLDEREGKVKVQVTTAVALDAGTRRAFTEAIRGVVGAEPVLTARVDERILGGALIRVGDRLYDASVATGLRRMKDQLLSRAGGATR